MYSKRLFILFIGFMLFSCNGNKMKVDENELIEQIQTEEAEMAKANQSFVPEIGRSTGASVSQMKESRSPDADNPPIILDILSGRENPIKIKTSDLFSEIRYIKLELLPDSSFYEIGADILISDKFIYGYSSNGIAQYSLDGYFIKFICKNESYYTKMDRGIMITSEQYNMFVGASNLKLVGENLYYQYEDRPGQTNYLMEYDEVFGAAMLTIPVQQENNQNIRGLGEPVMNLPTDNRMLASNEINPLGNGLVGFSMGRKSITEQQNFITVTSLSGDTVCSMKDFDPIENYSKSLARGAESAYNYYLDGILHLRQVYNDTIYRLIPPNHLVPKYILDFGEFGIESSLEAMDPGFSLTEKYVPGNFLESSCYLFFTYTKDYPCPNTAKTGTLKYSRLIYSKKDKKIIYVYTDEPAFYVNNSQMTWPSAPDVNIENDLDEGPFFWPAKTTSSGKPFSWFTKKSLDEKYSGENRSEFEQIGVDQIIISICE